MLTYYKGMKLLEKAAFSATYKSIWCAGPTIEFVSQKESVSDIISRLEKEYFTAFDKLKLLTEDKS